MMCLAWMLAALTVTASAQQQVSIEPARESTAIVPRRGNRYAENNRPLIDAVAYSFGIEKTHIAAPAWFQDAHYDFLADGDDEDPRPLLRREIERKFLLASHLEPRPVKVWVLRKAKVGRELKPIERSQMSATNYSTFGRGRIEGIQSMATLVRMLGLVLQPKVEIIDETELEGLYQMSVRWDPNDWNSLVLAFRHDLGLDLTEEYRDIDFLVIDSATRFDTPPVRHPCQPDAAVRAAISALPSVEDFSRPWIARMSPRWQLADRYPDDLFAALAVQDAIREKSHLASDWSKAIAHYRRMTDRSMGMLLEALLIAKLQPARARSLLSQALQIAPQSPWVRLALAAAGAEPEANLRAFRKACPLSLADAAYYDTVRDEALLHSAAEELNRAAASRVIDSEAIAAYPYLWRIRERTWRGTAAALRETVASEVRRIHLFGRSSDPVWISTLTEGYRRTGADVQMAAFLQSIADRRPSDAFQPVLERWNTIAASPDARADQLFSAADALMEAAGNFPDVLLEIPASILVARTFCERHLRPEQTPRLIADGLQLAEEQEFYRIHSELPEVRDRARERLARLRSSVESPLE